MAGDVQGLREAKAAFSHMPEIFRDRLNDATFVTISEIGRLAKSHLAADPGIRTRTLYSAIGYVMNWKTGRGRAGIQNITSVIANPRLGAVGNATRKIRGAVVTHAGRTLLAIPRRYGHFVEFGTRRMRAHPFMLPAAESQKQPYLERCRAAGTRAETDLARMGGRTV